MRGCKKANRKSTVITQQRHHFAFVCKIFTYFAATVLPQQPTTNTRIEECLKNTKKNIFDLRK